MSSSANDKTQDALSKLSAERERRTNNDLNSTSKSPIKDLLDSAKKDVGDTIVKNFASVNLFNANASQDQIRDTVRQVLSYDMKRVKQNISKEQKELLNEAKKMMAQESNEQYVD